MDLRDGQLFCGMPHFPVAQLMRQHGYHLLLLALLDQRVEQDNLLLPRQTREVGIAVRAPFAPVDDLQLAERELEVLRERIDGGLEVARLQGSEFIEKRDDHDGIDCDDEELHGKRKDVEVQKKFVAGLLDDGKKCAADG